MNKKRLTLQGIIIAICCVYIGYFFYSHKDGLHITYNFGWQRICLLMVIISIYYIVYARRMKRVIEECTDYSISSMKWLQLVIIGRFLNSILPQAGNLYRGVQLKNNMGVSYTHYISSSLSFFWLDIIFNLSMATLLLNPLLGIFVHAESLSLFAISFSALACVTIVPLVLYLWRDRIFSLFLIKSGKLGVRLSALIDTSIKLIHRTKFLLEFIGLSLVSAFLMVLVFREIFNAFGAYPDVTTLLVFFVFYRLTILIMLTPGNIGLREVGNGVISSLLLGDFAIGVLFTLALRIFSYAALFFVALILFSIETVIALKNRHSS